ncbi:hypothetical protein RYD26_12150, partial [Pasteurellaceae bacterium LIM206]|nr:hypothetical protein [Pasteurellaceae bacterium LIM206]
DGGYNGMIMDDATNHQRLDFQAQKDMNTKVLNDQRNHVKNNQTETIGNDQSLTVTNNQIIRIDNNQAVTVKGDQSLTVTEGNRIITLTNGNENKTLGTGSLFEEIKETRDSHAKVVQFVGDDNVILNVGKGTVVMSKEGMELKFGSSSIQLTDTGIFLSATQIHLNKDKQSAKEIAAYLAAIADGSIPASLAEEWALQSALIDQLRREGKHEQADELERQRHAKQAAKLAEAAYEPIGSTPPEGWIEGSRNEKELAKYGLSPKDFPEGKDFHARFFVPDPAVFGNDMKPTIAFRGTRMEEMADWETNGRQGLGLKSEHYERALSIGKKIKFSGNANNIELAGHSLGGGLSSAASRASGTKATTFNAAGLHRNTAPTPINSEIEAYRVKGEVLTRLQEPNPSMFDSPMNMIMDRGVAKAMPDAAYTSHYDLPKQSWMPIKGSLDDHGMDKVLDGMNEAYLNSLKKIK